MKPLLMLVALTLALLSGAYVLAQTPAPTGGAAGAIVITDGSAHGDTKGMMEKMSADRVLMLEKMSPEMKMRNQMLMNTSVTPNDAAAMLALKSQLKLTDAQAARLADINKEAQEKALAVLTTDQQKVLNTLPKSPLTMIDMHEQMMGQMEKMMGGMMGGQLMNCPMMDMVTATTDKPAHDMHDMTASPKP